MLGDANVTATIAVKDFDAAKKFYGETLGLKLKKESSGGATYQSGSTDLFVYPSSSAGTNAATYASWTVSDVEGTVEALKAKGVTFEQYDNLPGVTRQGDIHVMGELKAAWFKDPSGNILALNNGME